MGRNLCRKAHHMKGKAEKNEITFKNRSKFDFINEERKKHREEENPALDQPQCFYNELWMWIIPKVSIRLWNTWGQRLGHTPSSLSLSLSEIPQSDHLISHTHEDKGVRTGSMTSPNHTTLVAGSSVTSKNPCLLTPYPEHFSNCPAASFRGLLINTAKLWGIWERKGGRLWCTLWLLTCYIMLSPAIQTLLKRVSHKWNSSFRKMGKDIQWKLKVNDF